MTINENESSNFAGMIEQIFTDTYNECMGSDPVLPLTRDTVLLETGLDSLGFAILVARLEEVLGYDPFTDSDEAYYPETFGNFIDFYEKGQR